MSILDPEWQEGSAVGIAPWDIPANTDGGPRRGSLADYGGALIEDEDPKPPTDGSMLYADLCNGLQAAAAAADKVLFSFSASITLDGGGNPVLSQVTGPGAAAVIASLNLFAAGPGQVQITWSAKVFPTSILGPQVSLNDGTTTFGGGCNAFLINNGLGVEITTWTGASTPANRPFTVSVW